MKNTSKSGGLAVLMGPAISRFSATLEDKRKFSLSAVLACLLSLAACGMYGGSQSTAALRSLAITPATASQVVGDNRQFTATVTFSDNSRRDVTMQATWASGAEAIATITKSGGQEKAVAPGDTTISASFSYLGRMVSATAALHVTATAATIEAISVTPDIGQLELGANRQFTATARLTDGTTEDVTQSTSWRSSDPNVLRVNTTAGRIGLANTRGPGNASISADIDGVSASAAVNVVRRAPKFLYVAGGFGISGYAIDPATGVLTPVRDAQFTAAGKISSLAVSRDRKFLYAADSLLGVVWSFQIGVSGELVPLTDLPVANSTPTSLVAHPAADFLFMTDSSSGTVTTFSIAPDGSLAAVTPTTPVGRGPLFAIASPDGKFFYQALRTGSAAMIAEFSIAANGKLAPVPAGPVATEFRPSSLTIDPSGRFLYATIPSSSLGASTEVLGFSIDPTTGALTQIAGAPFNAGESPTSAAADASGRFLYVANNASSADGNSISAFSIDASTGALARVPGTPVPAPLSPFSVAVDPSGQYVYTGLLGPEGIRAFTIDQRTGALTEIAGSPFPAGGAVNAIATTF
jgi:6-phosphogluconolactonase (cycloisomerase 2 family)